MAESTLFDPSLPEALIPTFAEFHLHPLLLAALKETGYTLPTPIQASAIPVVMAGHDVMGAAQTGTGKTAAFTLPILHRLMAQANTSASPARHPVRALILTPTRELTDQVAASVKRYSKHTPLRCTVVFGGVDIGPQKESLRQGCEVLVATPGRLLDHIEQKNISLSQVDILVLDEADRMLDMGFLPDLDRIVRLLPARRQGLLFSATFSDEIRKLARSYLHAPVEIEVAARNAVAENVTQIAYEISSDNKQAAVVHVVKSRGLNQVIVFSNTKADTARLARDLERDGIKAASIHGDKSQADRIKALAAFKAGQLEVLVATDVAARGLDVAGVSCVINYDLPHNAEDYVHRIGRTGRAGASGIAIAFYTPAEERFLLEIEKLIQRPIPRDHLALPAELLAPARVTPEGERTRGRRAPHTRLGTQREGGAGSSAGAVDDFFLKPYEPNRSAASQTMSQKTPADHDKTSKRQVAVLLSNRRKA